MPAGRPPKGRDQVDDLEGPEQQKRRLKVVLETLSGERTVREVSSDTWVHDLRRHLPLRVASSGIGVAWHPWGWCWRRSGPSGVGCGA